MPEVKQNVILLTHTPEPERIITTAARLCYNGATINDLLEQVTPDVVERMIIMLKSKNHWSPFEHANFTFAVEGISRACSHQLVRHRIASYSQQSQRYVNMRKGGDEINYITPDSVGEIPAKSERLHPKHVFDIGIKGANDAYISMQAVLRDAGYKGQNNNQDARFVLPNACETKIMFTMNARTLINFFDLRTDRHAQWEIRKMANKMLELVKEVAPNIFRGVGHKYWEQSSIEYEALARDITVCELLMNTAKEYIMDKYNFKNDDNMCVAPIPTAKTKTNHYVKVMVVGEDKLVDCDKDYLVRIDNQGDCTEC